jgi:hypothetical protein
MMHGFESIRVAAHDANGVHHRVLPAQTGTRGALIQGAQVEFLMRGRLHLMPAGAQAGSKMAADKAAAAEEQDVHGLRRVGR